MAKFLLRGANVILELSAFDLGIGGDNKLRCFRTGGEQPERDRVLAAPVGVPVVRISRAPELLGQALNFLGIEAAREIGVDETPVEGERRLPGFLPFDERRVVERISSGRTSRARRIRRSRRPACGRPRR